jgi:flagellar motor switch protein FliM
MSSTTEAQAEPELSNRDVRLFDFRRPSTMSREHVRMIQIVQENLARGLATVFAGTLRAVTQVTPTEIEQCTYDEYNRSVPNPTLLTLLAMQHHRVGALFEMPLALAYAATELLLGGKADGAQPERAMTDLELSLMRAFVDELLPEFKTACEPIMQVEPEILGQESNPQFAQIASPSEMVILVPFKVQLESVTGTIRFCIPHTRLQPYLDAVSASNGAGTGRAPVEDTVRLRDQVCLTSVELAAVLRKSNARAGQIVDLEIGDVLLLSHSTSMPLSVHVQGVNVYEATLGRVNHQLALQIFEAAEPDRDARPASLRVIKARP